MQWNRELGYLLDLWAAYLGLRHPTTLVDSGFPSQALGQTSIIKFSIGLPLDPNSFLFLGR